MSVLIEGISYVVPNRVLDAHYPGGDAALMDVRPGVACISDGDLTAVTFATPADLDDFNFSMMQLGMYYYGLPRPHAAVVDMRVGPLRPCRWLEYRVVAPERHRLATVRLVGGQDRPLVVPAGWTWEGSATSRAGFPEDRDVPPELTFLRGDAQDDFYWNRDTCEVVTIARVSPVPTR